MEYSPDPGLIVTLAKVSCLAVACVPTWNPAQLPGIGLSMEEPLMSDSPTLGFSQSSFLDFKGAGVTQAQSHGAVLGSFMRPPYFLLLLPRLARRVLLRRTPSYDFTFPS